MNSGYYLLQLALVLLIRDLTATTSVKIDIQPKSVGIGDSLTVKCSLYNISKDDTKFLTFFQCPFVGSQYDQCYSDCKSVCQDVSCSNNDRFINTFKCDVDDRPGSLIYTYMIPLITKELIDNRRILPFSCKHKGIEVRDNVTVIERIDPPTSPKKYDNNYKTESTEKTTIREKEQKNVFGFGLQDIIIIILILLLITSFLINLWCCVLCCITRSKHNKRKRRQKNSMNTHIHTESTPMAMHSTNTMNQQPNYENTYPEEMGRRAKSQPALTYNGRNTPATNAIKAKTHSVENNSKYRGSIYSNNELYNSGLIPGNFNPQCYVPMVYGGGSYLPMTYGPLQPQVFDHMSDSQPDDMDTIIGNDIPDHRQSSKLQPLPMQPDNGSSILESVSSSHIV